MTRAHGIREAFAFRYMPQIAEIVVSLASRRATKKLRSTGPLKLLIDSTIHAHAITHGEAWVDTGVVLWGGVQEVPTGYYARIPVHSRSNSTIIYGDVCRITTICSLARRGLFELFTSAELMAERIRHPNSRFRATGYSEYSLLDEINIESIDGWELSSYTCGGKSKEDQARTQRARIISKEDELFHKILEIFGNEKHSQDCWHIMTAQKYGAHTFLTMDYGLINIFNRFRGKLVEIGVTVNVLTPTQLGDLLGFYRVSPHFFSYNSASFPIRSDLHLPDERLRGRAER